MIIYKGIEHNRFGEAPFVGALIIAMGCHYNCPGCFNQHLKEEPNLFETARGIINMVLANPFNQGIILGGLEWTDQPHELVDLVETALRSDLQVMIYTHMTQGEFVLHFPELLRRNIWCKFGAYEEAEKDNNYFSQGIKLATRNQSVRNLMYL